MSTLTAGNNRLGLGGSKKGNRRKLAPRKTNRTGGFLRLLRNLLITLIVLGVLAALSVGLLYGYRLITSHSTFDLKTISIVGNDRLTNGDVLSLAKLKLGMNCVDLNVGVVEEQIFRSPWIKAVAVRREFPSTLHIKITEREPTFWMRKGEVLYHADRWGQVIAPAEPGDSMSMPMLEIAPDIEDHRKALSGLEALVGKRGGPFSMDQVAWVRFLPTGQMEIFLDRVNLTLRMDVRNWREQLRKIGAVWTDLARRGENRRAAVISAGGDKVWVKLRDNATQPTG